MEAVVSELESDLGGQRGLSVATLAVSSLGLATTCLLSCVLYLSRRPPPRAQRVLDEEAES